MAVTVRSETGGSRIVVHESLLRGDRVLAAAEAQLTDLEDDGFCLSCGERRMQTEPDARWYPCEACGKRHVFGAMELILMGIGGE